MRLGDLLKRLAAYGDDTEVSVRTLEKDEVVLTVSATRVKIEQGEIVIVGDLDEVNERDAQ